MFTSLDQYVLAELPTLAVRDGTTYLAWAERTVDARGNTLGVTIQCKRGVVS